MFPLLFIFWAAFTIYMLNQYVDLRLHAKTNPLSFWLGVIIGFVMVIITLAAIAGG